MTKYAIDMTYAFKRDYKRAKKRNLPMLLIYQIKENVLDLELTRTGFHSDLF